MPTRIMTWQVTDGKLKPVDTSLADAGRREANDLEQWIASNPNIIAPDVVIIGRQTMTMSGPLDLLGIDRQGNIVVIELKRDLLPREALVQAMDYASDVAAWDVQRLSDICSKYTGKSLEAMLVDSFPAIDLESLDINDVQRIFLVGFGIDESLERMIQWLFDNYGFGINAILLKYVKTTSGDELLSRTAIISEAVAQVRTERKRSIPIPMSDEPGTYPRDELGGKLRAYLGAALWSAWRMRKWLFPLLLREGKVTVDQLKEEFVSAGEAENARQAGSFVALISTEFSKAQNDYLRQVVGYEGDPDRPWLRRAAYFLRPEFKSLVAEVLAALPTERPKELN